VAKIKAGVIGAGSFGELHVAVYQNLHDVEVVAISDPVETRLREVSRKYGGIDCYTDCRDLCARKDIQIVSIATPESQHLEPVLASAGAGKHILLEKPIATSLEDAHRIIEAARKANVLLMVGHILRFENKYATVKGLVEAGRLGTVVSIHARRNRPRNLYRFYGERVHGFVVNAIHDIDLCLWYTKDRVARVRAFTRNVQGGKHPDVNWGFLEFEGGAVACIETHWLIPERAGVVTNDALQIIGTAGIADIHFVPSGLSVWTNDGAEAANVSYDAWFERQLRGAIKEEIGYFVDCVRAGMTPTVITPVEALQALEVALALVSSSQGNREIKLNEG
jgi:UDP-N-acetylglucosamine 3-dehydrogenase